MKIMIAENIRLFRKERKLTQEQLAEAMGVTVGAVSKWESGASAPDLSIIVDLADFFVTSVDVLLGYSLRDGSKQSAVDNIRRLRNEKKFEEAESEAEKALKKYPNSFDVAFCSAIMYALKGVEKKSKKSYERALTLFERSLELINQNHNERINEWTIKNNIADVYLGLGKIDEALEKMKENNADGLNNASIGFTLAYNKKQADDALPYLSNALISNVGNLIRVINGYFFAFCLKKDYKSAVDVMLWMFGLISGLQIPEKISYIDMESTQLLTGCALASALGGDMAAAEKYLLQAKTCAESFDSAPDYSWKNIKLCYSSEDFMSFDDFGDTALDGIKNFLEEQDECPAISQLWQDIMQRNKT